MPATDRVRAVVEPAVVAAGLVLEAITTTPAGKRRVVRVVVDLPQDRTGSLSLDDVAEVSRAVNQALDADDSALGSTPYVLEVGTPGVDRPLTERRHWARARTRLVTVQVAGVDVTGRVVSVDDAGVVLDAGGTERVVPWAELGTGRMQVEFSRPGDLDDDHLDDDLLDDEDEHDETGDEPDQKEI